MSKYTEGIYLLIFYMFLIGGIVWLIMSSTSYTTKKDEACQDLEFKEYKHTKNFKFRKDFNGNLYYVEFDCKGSWFWTKECSAKLISVGDVRVV